MIFLSRVGTISFVIFSMLSACFSYCRQWGLVLLLPWFFLNWSIFGPGIWWWTWSTCCIAQGKNGFSRGRVRYWGSKTWVWRGRKQSNWEEFLRSWSRRSYQGIVCLFLCKILFNHFIVVSIAACFMSGWVDHLMQVNWVAISTYWAFRCNWSWVVQG